MVVNDIKIEYLYQPFRESETGLQTRVVTFVVDNIAEAFLNSSGYYRNEINETKNCRLTFTINSTKDQLVELMKAFKENNQTKLFLYQGAGSESFNEFVNMLILNFEWGGK